MNKRTAEQFEQALHRVSQGETVEGPMAPLVDAAGQVMSLSATPPPPPRGLVPGRQQFLAQAARLRAGQVPRRQLLTGRWQLATALAAIALLFGVVAGTAQAAAGSLPGEPLYSLKLASEQIRLALTSQPASRSALEQALAGERLEEIVSLLREQHAIDTAVSDRALRQLEEALTSAARLPDPAAAQALQRLAAVLEQREQALRAAAGTTPEPPVRELLREAERVRQEAQAGAADPEGLRLRLRQGTPAEPTDHTPQAPSPSRTPQQAHTPQGTGMPTTSPGPDGTPGPTLGPGATSNPTQGPRVSRTPEPTATSQPTPSGHASRTPGPRATSHTPEPPGVSRTPDPTATSQPTAGPNASHTPGPSATSPATEPPHAPRTPGPSRTPGPTAGPSGTPAPGQTPGPHGAAQTSHE